MSFVIFAFSLGIFFYYFLYQYPWLIIPHLLTGFLSYPLNFFKLWVAFSCGVVWIFLYVIWQNAWVLPSKLEGVPVISVGKIVGIPETKLSRTNFLFSIDHLENPSLKFIKRSLVQCSWENAPHLMAGEKWRLHMKLKKLCSTLNPGGFDYEAWAFSHGISATATIFSHEANLKLSASGFSDGIDLLRQKLAEKIDFVLMQEKTKGLMKALVVGDQSGILEEQWKVLRQTGTNHLFAIAGLHIGFVSHGVYRLCHWFSRRSVWLVLRLSAPLVSSFGALCASVIYSALAGFSLPTKRAVIMLTVFLMAKMRRRNVSFWNSWFIALGIILLMNPLQILTESFWLSFTAVGSLIYGFQGRIKISPHRWSEKLAHAVKMQWVTSVALIPLTLLLFQQASLVSFFANFIAIPCVGFLVAPFCLLGGLCMLVCPFIGGEFLKLAHFLLVHFWPILEKIGAIPNSQWYQAILNPWLLISGSLAVLLVLAPKGFPGRWLAFIWILPLIFYFHKNPEWGEAHFTLLDVGQGLSVIIRTSHHILIFDTGAHRKNSFDAGESILLPFLRWFHISHIDLLMVSHGDNDHIGGSETLLKALPVDRILTSVPERFLHRPSFFCVAGQNWRWDGVRFEVLSPRFGSSFTGNNSSCVLKVSTSKHGVLLTGDIEKEAENSLVKNHFQMLRADVLVAPHHGSKTSSTAAFIDAVRPKVALFPVGYRNQYHLPSPLILKRYQEKSVSLYDSVQCGSIEIDLTSSPALSVHCYREENRRFWRN